MRDTALVQQLSPLFIGPSREKRSVTVDALMRHMNVSYNKAYHFARRHNLPIVTKEEIVRTAYKFAATFCAGKDRDGIATIKAIAKERKIARQTARIYFDKNPELKKAWSVFDEHEAKAERIRRTVARMRRRKPDQKILRKALAYELRWDYTTLVGYLLQHQELITELQIVGGRSEVMREVQKGCVEVNKEKYRKAEQSFREKYPERKFYRADLARELGYKTKRVENFLRRHPEIVQELGLSTLSRTLVSKKVVAKTRKLVTEAARKIKKSKSKVTCEALAKALAWKISRAYQYLLRHKDLVEKLDIVYSTHAEVAARRVKNHIRRYERAAARFRRKNSGEKLTILSLSRTLKEKYDAVQSYLARHPDLIQRLRIELRGTKNSRRR